ncbi:MAG TPA: AAA family ATPase [Thermoanaerobaculia bacterium]|nr:AAA family ATPase [Thermoanaerobaculia bacterium]
MASPTEEIRRAILSRRPLLYVRTWEEERVVRLLEAFSEKLHGEKGRVVTWTSISGLGGAAGDTRDPVAALAQVVAAADQAIYVFKDLTSHFDDPRVVRALREAYYALRTTETLVVVLSPELRIPENVIKEIQLIEIGLPGEDELQSLAQSIQRAYPDVPMAADVLQDMAFAAKGLTLNEATHTFHRVFRTRQVERHDALSEVFADKEIVVKKAGYLEFIRPEVGLDQIGGLDNLKEWLQQRKRLFTKQAVQDGIPSPKGMLIMGISGCGKSVAAKAVSSLWDVPLYRLDMARVYSGEFGAPERALYRALETMEALAPAILWIDEIENGLGMDEQQEGKVTNTQIFSTFLTWMQEKPPLVFVAATANRIHALPAEFIRKGRFDQIYFVDLPTEEERQQIFEIHLRRQGADPAAFECDFLAVATKQWNGAEIEQAVIAARIDAYNAQRPMTIDDVTSNTSVTVPLARTMEEQVKKIRNWALSRATPASRFGKIYR